MTSDDIKNVLTRNVLPVNIKPASKETISRLKNSKLILVSNGGLNFIQKT